MQNRPLSPHLAIYKPQISSVLSIAHRISGFFLYLGLITLSWALIFSVFEQNYLASIFSAIAAYSKKYYITKILVFLWSAALFYHLFNGIRHLFWDIGYGFSKKSVVISGIAVTAAALISTIFAWCLGFNLIG